MEETNSLARSRRMGEMPEGKLLLSMAVPMMLSMLVQALYNIVDSVYVAKVSEDCLSALSLAFPAQNILIGLATGTGVGVSTMLSRALGSRDNKLANRVAGNSLFLCVCCWIIMAIFGMFFADAFIHSQTDIESIRSYGDSYLRIVTIGSVFVYFEINFERLLQSTGQTKLSMWAQIIGAVANIILDPFFIYGWCGLPAMGTTGAAIATVIGQAFGALAGFLFHHKHNKEVNIRLSDCRPDGRIILDIYRIGFPSILMVGIGSLTNYLMNRILMAFTSTAVALYGAYFKLQSFFFMPVFGLNNGIVPIVGYNYGARKKERIYRTIRYGVLYAVCILAVGLLLFEAIPGVLLQAFSPSEHMLAIGIPALRMRGDYLAIITLGFGEIIRVVANALPITGGAMGLSGIPAYTNFTNAYWVMIISVFVIYAFIKSRHGRAVLSIREDEIAAEASGVRTTYYKMMAFVLAAFFAGIAGGLYAHQVGVLAPSKFDFNYSVEFLVMVVLGGMGSITGSIIAATVLTILPEALRGFSDYRMLLYSVVLIVMMLFRPTGLLGTYEFSLTRMLSWKPKHREGKKGGEKA